MYRPCSRISPGRTTNASLHPVLTPRSGRPKRLHENGMPTLRRRSKDSRAGAGMRIHGLPGVSSNGSEFGLHLHLTTLSRSATDASMQAGEALSGCDFLRHTRSEG